MVVARHVVRAVTASIVLLSFAHLMVLGCLVAWFRMFDSDSPFHSGMWLFIGAASACFVAGTVSLIAWAWSR